MKPRALKPGDRIAVVSPASPFSREAFEKGVGELRTLGYVPVYHDSVFDRALGGMTSGPAELRAAAFVRAWSDPSIAALIAVRGGHGSVHMLPHLEGWDPRQNPKLFIGYSDNTSILAWLTTQCGITALHGPMLDGRLARGTDGYDRTSFSRLIQGSGAGLVMAPEGLSVVSDGEASGPLHGGTLTLLAASMGTPYAFAPPDGSVLFLEDVNERPYKIDRLLMQLRLAGVVGRARAIVFGEMRGCDEPGGELKLRDLLPELLEDFEGPVLFGFPSGHTTGPCWSLPFGVRVTVKTSPAPSVAIEESPVE
ncbi:MAG: LD-carboxypeptidase [Vicinamibacterales bacterium]